MAERLRRVDLAVVGAGPAGSAAAVRALMLEPCLRVALVDPAEFPRDKPCGDGLGPEAVSLLDRLGLSSVLDGYPAVRRVRVCAPSGRQVEGVVPRAGRVVPRSVLDARLRDAALDRGAEPVRRRVRSVTPERDRVVLDGALAATAVVAADGANSTLRRVVGAGRQPRRRTGLAMRGYAPAPVDDAALSIAFVADRWPAYAWSFSTGTGLRNVGYGPFDATTVSSRRDLEASLHRLLPDAVVDPASLRAHHLPLSTARPDPAVGRVLLAGDAASLINPLTGEGIAYALLSGAMAGAAAARYPDCPATVYWGAMRRRLGRHHRHVRLSSALLTSARPVELAVSAARDRPGVLAELSELALGPGLLTPRIVTALLGTASRRPRPDR